MPVNVQRTIEVKSYGIKNLTYFTIDNSSVNLFLYYVEGYRLMSASTYTLSTIISCLLTFEVEQPIKIIFSDGYNNFN